MRLKKQSLRLNLGCGSNKIEGYVNIDTEKSCKPDLACDFIKEPLPYKTRSVDDIVLFHTIEHIIKPHHRALFLECHRVLKNNAQLLITYPNFWECAKRWKENKNGKRTFWHATLYGRQLYPSDFHVSAMDPDELGELLRNCGFFNIRHTEEQPETYNTITSAVRGLNAATSYERLLERDHVEYTLR